MDLYLDKMMRIDKIKNDNSLLDHLHIHRQGLSAKIYPNLGASLQQLRIGERDIIDGISNDSSGLEDYAGTYKSSVLFPFPNRIEDGAYTYQGKSYKFPINETNVNNAIHGMVYNKAFEVGEVVSQRDQVSVELIYVSNGSLQGFPFEFEFRVTYVILATGSITLRFDVTNLGEKPFPYGLGWHPYFLADNLKDAELSFPSIDHFVCNDRSLPLKTVKSPLGKRFKMEDKKFDDAYSLQEGFCDFETRHYKLAFDFDIPENTYLQVYTPPHGKSIALEPMTCIANSFNSNIGLQELQPGASNTWIIAMKINVNV